MSNRRPTCSDPSRNGRTTQQDSLLEGAAITRLRASYGYHPTSTTTDSQPYESESERLCAILDEAIRLVDETTQGSWRSAASNQNVENRRNLRQ